MKKFTFIFCLLFLIKNSDSQNEEFIIHNNGLIYNESTMSQLKHIVDSLNLKFKRCELNKSFISKCQARGVHLYLKKGNIQDAIADMKKEMKLDDFLFKYPETEVSNEILIIKSQVTDYDGTQVITFSEVPLGNRYGASLGFSKDADMYDVKLLDKFVFRHSKKSSYSEEKLEAFYFKTDFKNVVLPEFYARMIQYADCMIDTNSTVLKEKTEYGRAELPDNYYKLSLNKKKKLLEEMRSTRVVGFCSMDQSPRIHAMNIALVSAETVNWEIFLRAHLDIMNDNFSRMSDRNYAWERRKTYIKELEELEINVPDLVFGICLRYENPCMNHYFGDIGRIGRALAETEYNDKIEHMLYEFIKDNSLDEYNRVLFYFLFTHYNHYLEDEERKKENSEKMKDVITYLPDYLAESITPEN